MIELCLILVFEFFVWGILDCIVSSCVWGDLVFEGRFLVEGRDVFSRGIVIVMCW